MKRDKKISPFFIEMDYFENIKPVIKISGKNKVWFQIEKRICLKKDFKIFSKNQIKKKMKF